MPQHLKCLATAVIYDLPLITKPVSNCHLFSDITLSQGTSVATRLRCGVIFSYRFTANLSLSLTVKEFCKSVMICQSYRHEFGGPVFLEHSVYQRILLCLQTRSMIEQLTEYLYPTSASYETSSSRTTYDSHQSVVYRTSAASDEPASSDTSAALRVGAFNVRVFGQKKVTNAGVLNILIQVLANS